MSKTDPYVRELLSKNQYAEALRYYRTRYKADRADAMRVLQEIQDELKGAKPSTPTSEAMRVAIPPEPQRIIAPAPTPSAPPPAPPKSAPPPAPPPPAPIYSEPVYSQPMRADAESLSKDGDWNRLAHSLREEIKELLLEDKLYEAIRQYWYESGLELRDAKARVSRWAQAIPPRRR